MALIEWKESLSTGIDVIDADHKLLISLTNQLYDAMESGQTRDVVESVLNVLEEYVDTHFAREELLMKKAGYPHLEAHCDEHKVLAEKVKTMMARCTQDDHPTNDQELLDFLKSWLTEHIMGVDMHYRPFMQNVSLTPEELMSSFNLQDPEDETN